MALAIFITLAGQDLAKGYMAAKTTLLLTQMCFPCGESNRPFFPSLPHLSRFYRVLRPSWPTWPSDWPKAQGSSRWWSPS
ncbi:hypothetical protein ACLWNE_11670 (plasmid) [Thermus oshimai]|uniref:hypothetical protein n=1 Tax=Thermus oshimai TaxID=56957 RepID=UPI0039A54E60